jgi:DNA-binding MarR family transcriptional regulator
MTYLMRKNLPRYEQLLEAAQLYPELDPTACEAFLHLLRTGNDVTHEVETYFAKHNLTQGRFFVLMLLMDKLKHAPISRTPAELAEVSGVTRATMTGLIDTLEKDGLVTREPDPKDHRMVSVKITTKGVHVLKQTGPGHLGTMSSLMRFLNDTERKTLVSLLGKVLKAVEETKAQNPETSGSANNQ